MRTALIAVGVIGLVATVVLLGKIQEWRRSDENACMVRDLAGPMRDCAVSSYAPAIFVGALSVVCLVVAAKWQRRAAAD